MNNIDTTNLDKLLALSKDEIDKIFMEFSLSEIEDLLNKLDEVISNE